MNRDLSNYQKAEDFQKYIDENNIEYKGMVEDYNILTFHKNNEE